MKKLILSLSILISIGVNAQTPTLTQSNHAPTSYTYASFNCDTAAANTSFLPGNSGNGVMWNFTGLVTTTVTNNFTSSTYTDSQHAPANYSVTSGGNTSYYQSKVDSLNLIAATAVINGLNVTLNYTTPAVLAKYPMNYSDNVNTNTAGNINGSGSFTGNCDVTYDAVGNMLLPLRTFGNITRLKTIQTYTYNLAPLYTGDVKTETCDYYFISSSRVPILSVSTTTLNNNDLMNPGNSVSNQVQKFITVLKDYQYVGIQELEKNKIEVNTFPNPATNHITFSTTSKDAVKVIVTDINGKTITTESFEMGNAKLNVSNLSAGMYLYNVLNKNNEVLARDKFNVTK